MLYQSTDENRILYFHRPSPILEHGDDDDGAEKTVAVAIPIHPKRLFDGQIRHCQEHIKINDDSQDFSLEKLSLLTLP